MEKEKLSDYVNILKGIGIFFVVVGHTAANVIPGFYNVDNVFHYYVYSYHLALFFFVAGFLYNESKYQDSPSLLFVNRFKRCYAPFFFYCFFVEVFFFLIPSLSYNHSNKIFYDFFTFFKNVISFSLMQNPPAPYAMSLWFIPTFILSCSFFGLVIFFANKIKEAFSIKNDTLKNILIILFSILFSIAGYYETKNFQKFTYRIELAFFVIPLLTMGYFIRKYVKNLDKFLNYYVAILFLFVSIYLTCFASNLFKHPRIDLKEEHFNYYQFFSLAILGIYQAMYFAKVILESKILKYLKSYLCILGKASFEIMAFHRVVFFLINSYILASLRGLKINDNLIFNISLIFYAAFTCFVISYAKEIILKLKRKEK